MAWSEIYNHDSVIERFQKSFDRNRLASTYLFVGPPGIGKRKFALKLAQVLLCENSPDDFDSCGQCPACQQVAAQTHPDLVLISKPKDKAFIPVDTFIGRKEHRHQEGLCHDIGLKPFRGGRKIAIVDDADFLNQEGANCLLKTLEEPPPKSMLILIGTSEQQQLPTIISRSQVIRFNPLTTEQVHSILTGGMELESDVSPESLAAAAEGSIERAILLADKETFDFRNELFQQLSTCDPGQNDFAKSVSGFVDTAGKDAAKKRARLSIVGDFAISFFRHWYLAATGIEMVDQGESDLQNHVLRALSRFEGADMNFVAEIAGQAIERCLELQRQLHANANQANIVEAWLIDIGKISRGNQLVSN